LIKIPEKNVTTIQITKITRDILRELEIYPKEPYEEIITRLIDTHKLHLNNDKDEEDEE